MEVQTTSGFDLNECYIRVYVSKKMSKYLREAKKVAMGKLPAGSKEPMGTGPPLDLSGLPLDAQMWIIDGLHRVTALRRLLDLWPNRGKRYSKVTAVFYTHDILPHVLILSQSSNMLSENHVADDNLGKLTYYRGLLENYVASTGIDVFDESKKSPWPPVTIWVYEHIGKSALLNEGGSATARGKNVTGFSYTGQCLQMARNCDRPLIEWFTKILDQAEKSEDEVSPNHLTHLTHFA
jgi:hypothetical protein